MKIIYYSLIYIIKQLLRSFSVYAILISCTINTMCNRNIVYMIKEGSIDKISIQYIKKLPKQSTVIELSQLSYLPREHSLAKRENHSSKLYFSVPNSREKEITLVVNNHDIIKIIGTSDKIIIKQEPNSGLGKEGQEKLYYFNLCSKI